MCLTGRTCVSGDPREPTNWLIDRVMGRAEDWDELSKVNYVDQRLWGDLRTVPKKAGVFWFPLYFLQGCYKLISWSRLPSY